MCTCESDDAHYCSDSPATQPQHIAQPAAKHAPGQQKRDRVNDETDIIRLNDATGTDEFAGVHVVVE